MLKGLAILALFLLTTGHMSGQPDNQSRGDENQSKADPNTESPHWYTLPEWWLFILGVPTLIFVGYQSRLMAKHAEHFANLAGAAKDAANAALRNAETVISAERGRLLFEVEKVMHKEKKGAAEFLIYAVNYGRSPAEILGFSIPSEVVQQFANSLAIPPQYESETPPVMRFLAPNAKHFVGSFSPGMPGFHGVDVLKLVEAGVPVNAQSRMAYGQIRYLDGISAEVRHSRYCFRHERFPFSNIGGSLVPSGPREYNECT